MDSTMISLLPLIISSALVPASVIFMLLLLTNGEAGLIKASAYFAGRMTLRLIQGLVFSFILAGDEASGADESGKSLVVSTLMIVLGILLLISAYKQWRKDDDSEDAPPKLLDKIDNLNLLQSFGLGFGLLLIGAKSWVFTLSALGVISQAELGQPGSALVYFLFLLLADSLLILALMVQIFLPKQGKIWLEAASTWLNTYNRQIITVFSLVFGLLFFYQGVGGFF